MRIGEKIKELRNERKLTLKQLGKRIDMSISFLSDIENGKSNPSLERTVDIANGLGIPVSCLLGEAPLTEEILSCYSTLLYNADGKRVLELLTEFPDWKQQDREELIAYLTAKNISRRKLKE